MSLWRIRIALSDDPRSQELLSAALAEQRVWSLMLVPRDTEMTADVIIELPGVDGLGTLLGELHMFSPQVLVSSADQPSPLATAGPPRNGAPVAGQTRRRMRVGADALTSRRPTV